MGFNVSCLVELLGIHHFTWFCLLADQGSGIFGGCYYACLFEALQESVGGEQYDGGRLLPPQVKF